MCSDWSRRVSARRCHTPKKRGAALSAAGLYPLLGGYAIAIWTARRGKGGRVGVGRWTGAWKGARA